MYWIAEDNVNDIPGSVEKVKQLFQQFTVAHNDYHSQVTNESELVRSDDYHSSKQREYIEVLNLVKDAKRCSDKANEDLTRNEMLSMMNLPKLELQVFDGNPLHYQQFKRSFTANVDKVCDDPDI